MSIKAVGRARSFALHHYLGLVYGAYLCMMSLTGAVIVFSDEISRDHVLTKVANGTAQSLQGQFEPDRKYEGSFTRVANDIKCVQDATGRKVVFYKSLADSDSFLLTLAEDKAAKSPHHVLIQKGYGSKKAYLLESNEPEWLHLLTDLHHNLLCGKTGRTVNGVMAILLLVLLVSGALILTFENGYWKAFSAAHRSRWPMRARNYHIAMGGCNGPILAAMAVCAIYFGFPDQAKTMLGVDLKSRAVAGVEPDAVGLAKAMGRAFDLMPPGGKMPTTELDSIAMPKKNNRAVRYWFRGQFAYTNEIWMDGFDGEQLAGTVGPGAERRESLLMWFARFHFGKWAGYFSKAMWVILGWMPVALYVTGCWMWRKKMRSEAKGETAS